MGIILTSAVGANRTLEIIQITTRFGEKQTLAESPKRPKTAAE